MITLFYYGLFSYLTFHIFLCHQFKTMNNHLDDFWRECVFRFCLRIEIIVNNSERGETYLNLHLFGYVTNIALIHPVQVMVEPI